MQACKPQKGACRLLDKVSTQTAPFIDDGRTSKELMDELYDEDTGLPK